MQSSSRAKVSISLALGIPVFALALILYAAFWRAGVLAANAGSALSRSAPLAGTSGDWPTYLHDNGRSGFNGSESIINATSAASLKLHWSIVAGAVISTQPVIANGVVYWGSWDGLEHATDLNGHPIWSANLGKTTDNNPNCSPNSVGVASTATVATVTIKGALTPVVFVGGGNAHFYALNAHSGAVIWQIVLGSSPSHFLWSSPLVYKGSVYMGIASLGDCPTVQGQLVQMNVTTGVIQHRFNVEPAGCTGGAVWGSPTVDQAAGMIYIATGNTGQCSTAQHYANALVQLHASDLSLVSFWQVPAIARKGDKDFGATPTLFQATIGNVLHKLVGVVCKNGIYYAFDRAAISKGPVWQDQVAVSGNDPLAGEGSISSSAWDGTTLYVAGGNTTINGNSCQGSLRAINPATGTYNWEACLTNGPVLGAVTAVAGVAAVGEGPTLVLIATNSGQTLFTYTDTTTGSNFYGPPSISNGVLYTGNADGNLYAFGS